jgi:hypothetical protein
MARHKRIASSQTDAAMPASPVAWQLQIVIEEDEELSARRFTVWIAPAGNNGVHLCIGSGPTRIAAIEDADLELRGALGLLRGQECEAPPPCEKCGWRADQEARQ